MLQRTHLLPYTLLAAFCLLFSASAAARTAAASPVGAGDAYKAIVQLFAYDAEGKLLREGTAFFIGAEGEAATTFQMLSGAARAEVIDTKGKKYAVGRILGANATTDLVKFSVEGTKDQPFFALTSQAAAEGTPLLLLPARAGKKAKPMEVKVTATEPYNDFRYYDLSLPNEAAHVGLPLFTAEGVLAGIVQGNVQKEAQTACAIDARFLSLLNISSTSALQKDLREIAIPKALPNDPDEALTYLFMLKSADPAALPVAYDDFVAQWPDLPDGYVNRATLKASQQQFEAAETDFQTAIEKAQLSPAVAMKEDAVRYQLSTLIVSTLQQHGEAAAPTANWTLERAEAEAQKAYELSPGPLYLMQRGYCRFAQKNYAGAYECFEAASANASFASPETFFTAARALELSGGDSLRVLALLDSCVARLPQPLSARDAQYVLERVARQLKAQRYREAVAGYNEYEKAIGPRNLTGQFYFLRSQAEMEAHMYQQALDDIRTAIAVTEQPLAYRLEEAFILLRVGEFEAAAEAAEKLLADLPESPDCYRVMGIAHGELGHKAKAKQYLERAAALGDEVAPTFIQKYQ